MRHKRIVLSRRTSWAAVAVSTLVVGGCDTSPSLRRDEATRVCERLYRTQQLRGEHGAAVKSCYEAIRDEIGLADSTPTR